MFYLLFIMCQHAGVNTGLPRSREAAKAFPFPVIRVGVQNPEVSSVLEAAAREEPSAARVKAP